MNTTILHTKPEPIMTAPSRVSVPPRKRGSANGPVSGVDLGALPALYMVVGIAYILGSFLFAIATLRAVILSCWAAVLLIVEVLLLLVLINPSSNQLAALIPSNIQHLFAMPLGLAMAWLGYALWSERRAHASEPSPARGSQEFHPIGAD